MANNERGKPSFARDAGAKFAEPLEYGLGFDIHGIDAWKGFNAARCGRTFHMLGDQISESSRWRLLAAHNGDARSGEFDDRAEFDAVGIALPGEAGFEHAMHHRDDAFAGMIAQQPERRKPIEVPLLGALVFRAGKDIGDDADTKLPPATGKEFGGPA